MLTRKFIERFWLINKKTSNTASRNVDERNAMLPDKMLKKLVIRFSVSNYAIAESQAVIRYSNEVIELMVFSEKLFSPWLINLLTSFIVFGS